MTLDTDHNYQQGTHKFKQSVTGLVESLCPPFEAELIAPKVALKAGVDTQVILDKWSLNGQVSRDFGQAIHGAIEYRYAHGQNVNHPVLARIVDEFFALKPTSGPVHSEMAVYSEVLSLCGTMDILEVTGTKIANIHDIKTSDLDKVARGKIKILDIPCTPLNKYRVQLSVYKHLMELLGWKINELIIWNYTGEWKKILLEPLNVDILWQTQKSS